MHIYLGVPFDGAADGGAVTGHYRSVDKGLSKLGRTGLVFLRVGCSLDLQVFGGRRDNLFHLHKSEMWLTPLCVKWNPH